MTKMLKRILVGLCGVVSVSAGFDCLIHRAPDLVTITVGLIGLIGGWIAVRWIVNDLTDQNGEKRQ